MLVKNTFKPTFRFSFTLTIRSDRFNKIQTKTLTEITEQSFSISFGSENQEPKFATSFLEYNLTAFVEEE